MTAPLARISLARLRQVARSRPAGYLDDVLARAASVTPTHVLLRRSDLDRLRRKYGTARRYGLGDVVYHLGQALGLRHCGRCDRRRRWLNGLTAGGRR